MNNKKIPNHFLQLSYSFYMKGKELDLEFDKEDYNVKLYINIMNNTDKLELKPSEKSNLIIFLSKHITCNYNLFKMNSNAVFNLVNALLKGSYIDLDAFCIALGRLNIKEQFDN